jgi:fatty-acyl-CoA synthase
MSEVYVRSPSLFSGYKADPQRTRERLHDDELATGDLGFLHEGELYLVGRTDDLLSVGGRNVYAHEIETAVGGLDALRKGAVTMVETPTGATPRLTMLIEVRDRRLDFAEISATVSGIVATTAGINLDECVFLPRGTLPKTPTGKIQRFRCRQLVMDDPLGVVARVCTSGPGAGSPSGFAEVTRA